MKKLIKLGSAIIFSLLTILTIILCLFSKGTNTLVIENIEGTNYIDKFIIGETEYSKEHVSGYYGIKKIEEEVDDNESKEYLILESNNKYNIKVSKIQNINILFQTETKGKVNIKLNDKEVKLNLTKDRQESYQYQISLTSALFSQIKSFSIKNYIIIIFATIVLSIIYSLIIESVIKIFKRRNDKDLQIKEIIYLFITYFVINLICFLPVIELLHMWYFLVIAIQLILITYCFKKHIAEKLQNIFALFAIVLTVNMAILLPPFHVPDEIAHYVKAYSIFNSSDVIKKDHAINLYSNMYPIIYKYNSNLHSAEYKTTIKEYFVDATVVAKGEKEYKYNYPNTYYSNVFSYLPSAIVIKLNTILNLPFMLSALLGRIVSALIFIIFGFLALKIIPFFKKSLLVVMLFPITIQQVTAINQDSLTLSIFFLLTALILKCCHSTKKVNNKEIWIINILSLCLGMCKPGYFLVALLTLLIPKENFTTKKQLLVTRLLPIALCFLATSLRYFDAPLYTGNKVEGVVTFEYALTHIPSMIKICLGTIYSRLNLDLLTGQINLFGWSTIAYNGLPCFLIYILYSIIVFSDNLGSKEKKFLTNYNRCFIILLAILLIGIMYASALFAFKTTSITATMISGLQSRYFIPVTCLLAIGTANNLFTINIKNKNIFSLGIIILTFAISFCVIIHGFYV